MIKNNHEHIKKALDGILYSNSFYGITAVALAVENNLVLQIPLNHWAFYLLLFCGTIIFYQFSYRYDPHPLKGNKRALWIKDHRLQLVAYQNLLMLTLMAAGVFYWINLPAIPFTQMLHFTVLLSVFPVIGFLYYGISFPGIFNLRLRSFGWFKPFIIGAVWAGCVSFIPWIMHHWENQSTPALNAPFIFFSLHNWMFISVLAILFDIKDYAADHNHSLKTFVVRKGLRMVIYSIVLPLILVGIAVLSIFLSMKSFTLISIILYLVPMGLLYFVTVSMSKRRPIAWYLLVIDGLMLIKAFFGIVAVALG